MSDLNIENYSVQEMHNILQLDNPTKEQINVKVDSLVSKMKEKGKNDMANFLEEIRERLVNDDTDDESQDENGDFAELTELMGRSRTKKSRNSQIVNIDSRFRSDYYNSLSTSFTVELPETQTDVTGIYISSMEIPHSFYSISDKLDNNKMLIWQPEKDGINSWIITLQDSNYDVTWFEDSTLVDETIQMINLAINNPSTTEYGYIDSSTNIFYPRVLDQGGIKSALIPGILFTLGESIPFTNLNALSKYESNSSGTAHIKRTHLWNLTEYECYIFFNISGPYTIDGISNCYKIDTDKNVQFMLGWSLGFRAASYRIPANNTRLIKDVNSSNLDYNVTLSSINTTRYNNSIRIINILQSLVDNHCLNFNLYYPSSDSVIFSESLAFLSAPRYAFLCIDDFQNNSPSTFVQCYNDWSTSKNIVARVNIAENYQALFSTLGIKREKDYHGPVNIKKLKIDLLDEYGRNIDLNYQDWSFTIEFLKDKK